MWDHGVLVEAARITWLQGTVAGACAGVAMALAMGALSRAAGEGFWHLPKRLAAIVLGPKAKDGGIGTIAFGIALHEVLSAGFGALFAAVANDLTHEFYMTGLAYGLTLWVLNFWGAQVTPGGKETAQLKSAWLGPIAHIVYGGVLAALAVVFASSALHSS